MSRIKAMSGQNTFGKKTLEGTVKILYNSMLSVVDGYFRADACPTSTLSEPMAQ